MLSSRTAGRARLVVSLLFLPALLSMAACHHRGRGSTLPPAVRRDPLLATVPFGTDLVVTVDLEKLRLSPTYAPLRPNLRSLAVTMDLGACGEEPFDSLAAFTIAQDFDAEPMLVLRASAVPLSGACGEAWARALLGTLPGRSAAIGPLRLYAPRDRFDALRSVIVGDARSLADDPRYEPMRARLRDSGFAALVDLDAMPLAQAEIPPILGLSRDPTLAMLEAATVQVLDVQALASGGLRITAVTGFANVEDPQRALALVTEAWARNIPFARAAMLSVPSALELTDVNSEAVVSLEGIVDDVQISADESTLRVETELDDAALTSATELLRRAFERYLRLAQSTEARSNVLRLADAMRTLVEQRFRETGGHVELPSAPSTPASVPRGVAVVDPPGTWEGELFRLLQFSIAEPHRYSYAITAGSDGFHVSARGDLDGDGQTSEFGMRGTLHADGTVELGELEVDSELE